MQQHPIPQNITGFEFKLIGDMTIKQFAYLAAAAIISYLTIVSPLNAFVKIPLLLFFILLAIGLAFIPVEGRPLDRWIVNFIRALFAPSQYIFHKEGGKIDFFKTYVSGAKVIPTSANIATLPKSMRGNLPSIPSQQTREKFTTFLQNIPTKSTIDREEKEKIKAINEAFSTPISLVLPVDLSDKNKASASPVPSPILSGYSVSYQPAVSPLPSTPPPSFSTPVNNDLEFEEKLREEQALEKENKILREEVDKLRQVAHEPIAPPVEKSIEKDQLVKEALMIEKKLQEALTEKERLAAQLAQLKSKLMIQEHETPVTPMQPSPAQTDKVRVISPTMAKEAGVAGLPQTPNIVSGIVKDGKGDVLPNIIIEVKDGTGNPVRAFKTSKLGQFFGATPLANGKYTIELEDPKHTYTFDIIGIELTGSYFRPIEITAKDQATSQRQQLYQALFGKQTSV